MLRFVLTICCVLSTVRCMGTETEITEQQCIDSLADDDSAIVEQCADCFRAEYDSCGDYACFCGWEDFCVEECPDHPF